MTILDNDSRAPWNEHQAMGAAESKLVTYVVSRTTDVTTFDTEMDADEDGVREVPRADADWKKAYEDSDFTLPKLLAILEKEAYKHIAKCENISYWREVIENCKGWNFNELFVENL